MLLIELVNEASNGGFARARSAHDGHRFSLGQVKADIAQDPFFVLISKPNVIKFYIAAKFWRCYFGGLFDIVDIVDEFKNTICCYDAHLNVVKTVGNGADRSKKQVDEHNKGG